MKNYICILKYSFVNIIAVTENALFNNITTTQTDDYSYSIAGN